MAWILGLCFTAGAIPQDDPPESSYTEEQFDTEAELDTRAGYILGNGYTKTVGSVETYFPPSAVLYVSKREV